MVHRCVPTRSNVCKISGSDSKKSREKSHLSNSTVLLVSTKSALLGGLIAQTSQNVLREHFPWVPKRLSMIERNILIVVSILSVYSMRMVSFCLPQGACHVTSFIGGNMFPPFQRIDDSLKTEFGERHGLPLVMAFSFFNVF